MKKVLFTFVAALIGVSAAWADEFTVGHIEISQGGTAELEVGLINSATQCPGFQFQLYLPEGVTVAKDTENEYIFAEGSRMIGKGFTTQMSWYIDHYQILSYNALVKTMDGTSGTVISLTLKADDNLAVGTVLNASLRECKISNKDAESLLLNDVINFTITVGEPDDGRIHFNETSTTLPTYTAGEKGDVTMNRTIKANQWNTIVLPFTLTKAKAEAAFGSDVQLAEFSGFTVDYGDDDENVTPLSIVVNFSTYTMSAKKPMTGGKMFLIKTSSEITSFEADDCTLVATVTDTEKTDEYDTAGKFTGSFVKTKVPADGLFIAENKFWYSTGETNIKAFRGWFELGAVLDKETDFGAKVAFFIDDIPTSVDGLDVGARHQQGDVYTLDGLYVGRNIPMERLKKGIYIVNGKKVVIK